MRLLQTPKCVYSSRREKNSIKRGVYPSSVPESPNVFVLGARFLLEFAVSGGIVLFSFSGFHAHMGVLACIEITTTPIGI